MKINLPSSIKALVAIVLMTSVGSVSAATYYVSPGGSDSNTTSQAQSASTPWKTIQHAANNMVAGDTCIIRAGTYRETVTVPKSGTSSAPITFKAYDGEVVTINGADPVSGWVSKGNNLYDATISGLFLDNGSTQVFMNGTMKPEARWPNAGAGYPWLDASINPSPDFGYVDGAGYDSSNAHGWITDAALPARASGYWTGASLHILAGYSWGMNTSKITAYDSTTKKITTDDNNGGDKIAQFTVGNQFYITGKKGELDSNGEWFYEPSTSTLSFYSTSGTPSGVEAKKRAYGFDLSSRSYINLLGLHFFGCTINTSGSSTYCTFDGLNMKYLGHSENHASICGLYLRDHYVLKNSELAWDSFRMLTLYGNDIKVINNHLHDTAYTAHKGGGMIDCSVSTTSASARELISHNTMHDSGLMILHYPGASSIIEYNEMYNAQKLCRDGGIVYVANFDAGNTVMRYNLLHGAPGGVGQKGAPNQGLYIDNLNNGWIVHHNIIWDVPNMGIFVNRRHCLSLIFNNVFYGNNGGTTGGYFVGPANQDGEAGVRFYNNILNGPPLRDVSDMDFRFNCYQDPKFVDMANGDFRLQSSSPARDKGILIPGVTDGYTGSAPDIGALEYGGTDWTQQVGCQSTPLSVEPSYKMPAMDYCNKIKDGSFESGALSPNWTVASGSAASNYLGGWKDAHVRTAYKSLKFDPGTTEVVQTVTGLLPNRTYFLYAGIQNTSSANSAKIGVRNYGRSTKELTSPLAAASNYFIYNHLSFTTGPSSTSADIYIHVTIPSGGSSVYVDDVGLLWSQDMDPQLGKMPILEYPFNETSGTVATDGSTYGRNGTLTGAAGWTSGFQGNSLKFDGTSTCVTTPSITTPTDEISISCWLKSPTATWNSSTTVISQRPALLFGGTSGSKKIQAMLNLSGVGATYFGYSPDSTFDITQWHHYVFTYSRLSGNRAFYIDGKWATSGSADLAASIVPTTAAILVGKDSTHFFSGQIDDLRIYGKELNQEEVAVLYNTDKTLALRLKFDESPGASKAWDSSGSGRNGILNGFDTSTAWVKGRIANALSFNGTSSYVSTPGMATPSTVTVAAWAKSSSSTWNADNCLVSKDPSFVLGPVKGTKNMKFTVKLAGVAKTATFSAGSTFDVTQWHHYVGSYSSSSGNLNLYVDGVMQNTVSGLSGGIDADSGGLFIGRDETGSNFLGGQVDDVQLYARELSASDVLDLSLRTYGPYDGSAASTVASNQPPTANAGVDKSITLPTSSVSLSGSGTDPDGSIASYGWTQVSGPNTASIGTPNSASTTVSGLAQGTYLFRLKVTDNGGLSATDDVNVTVNPAPNNAPTANAGADQTITLPANSVTLTGSGSDSDGSISSYSWSQVSGPNTATIGSASSASTSISALIEGTYVFRLTVTDNQGATGTDDVQIAVNPVVVINNPPTANAGVDKTVQLPINSVTLSGSGTDSDGTIASYAWTQVSGPNTASIGTPSSASTTVSGLVEGSYTFRLTVKDNSGASANDDVNVTVKAANVAPTANAGSDQTITLPINSVSLSGAGIDSDGTIASYAWLQVSGPSIATISAGTSATTTMGSLVQGVYVFRLTVKDNQGATGIDDVQVTVNAAIVANSPPTANAGGDKALTLPHNSLTVTGTGTDTDGTIASYKWTQVSGPNTAAFGTPNAASTTISGMVQGTYVFRLTVTDNKGATGTDDMKVWINQVRQFLVDCGPAAKTTPTTLGKAWNNLTTARTNDALNGLIDTSAKSSGIGITILDGFYQVTAGQGNSNGTASSTIYPATATGDSFFIGTLNGITDTSAKIRITGLNASIGTTYRIKLYASRVASDTSDRTTTYTINGVSQSLQVRNNVDGYVTFDKQSAPNGYLDVTINMKSGAVYGYLGVIDVTETSH